MRQRPKSPSPFWDSAGYSCLVRYPTTRGLCSCLASRPRSAAHLPLAPFSAASASFPTSSPLAHTPPRAPHAVHHPALSSGLPIPLSYSPTRASHVVMTSLPPTYHPLPLQRAALSKSSLHRWRYSPPDYAPSLLGTLLQATLTSTCPALPTYLRSSQFSPIYRASFASQPPSNSLLSVPSLRPSVPASALAFRPRVSSVSNTATCSGSRRGIRPHLPSPTCS
ncbi:hypothetical protein C8Q80DRAFT_29307 [Daedaleopsis nitida]|nr:hypothetical protein C8Q80DRAFT_29307 [Daedaleopsis nitida]